MTIIKYSALVSDQRGKLDNTIFSRNHAGFIQKGFARPFNPQSPYQILVRDSWSYLIKYYSTLPQDIRDNWDYNAKNINWFNKVGDSYHPTGQLLFLSCNQNLFMIGQPYADFFTIPGQFNSLYNPYSVFNFTGPHIPPEYYCSIYFPDQIIPDNISYMVYCTIGLSQGINYAYKYLKFISYIPPGTVNFFDISQAYKDIFSYPALGFKIFTKLRTIDINSGISAQDYYFNSIVQGHF